MRWACMEHTGACTGIYGHARACSALLHRAPTGLTALIERGGWWAQRASEGRPYTIGNREMKEFFRIW